MTRPVLLPLVLVLLASGCGLDSPAEPTPKETPAPIQQTYPQQQDPQVLQSLYQEVLVTYQSLQSLSADYDNRQTKGNEHYTATVHMKFAKPRKVRLDVTSCTDSLVSGASIVWLGGTTIKGAKPIGPLTIRQEHKLSEKPCLRGWLFNQTDYDAMVQALLQGLPNGRYLGNARIGGQNLLMVEIPSRLSGVTLERIGIDPTKRLPVYREIRETAQGAPVFTTLYSKLVPNASIAKDAFNL
ncbi:MAG TPA: hypothetical protein V6D05_18350 [Stenomitos sp.]